MRKFSQSIVGKGVTFTKLAKVRDSKGRVDYARQDIDGIVVESDGYIHSNVESSELQTWAEADRNIEDELSCLV